MSDVTMEMFELTPDEQRIAELREQIRRIEAGEVAATKTEVRNVAKNHKPGKADPSKRYVLRDSRMKMFGTVPRQQADLADLLGKNMLVGKEYTEPEVFDILIDHCGDYPSLYGSKQDVTYLFRYYRGFDKKDGKHFSFIRREFLRYF